MFYTFSEKIRGLLHIHLHISTDVKLSVRKENDMFWISVCEIIIIRAGGKDRHILTLLTFTDVKDCPKYVMGQVPRLYVPGGRGKIK